MGALQEDTAIPELGTAQGCEAQLEACKSFWGRGWFGQGVSEDSMCAKMGIDPMKGGAV